jgi:hypothetical protein
MQLVGDFTRWLAAVISAWYGWVGASATAGLVGFGQGMGWWGSPGRQTYVALFVLGLVISVFQAWRKQYTTAVDEKKKTEIAPDINVEVSTMITKGRLNEGVTDLFVYLTLTLKAPSEVTVRDFSMTAVQGTASMYASALDDLTNWEVMRSDSDLGYVHIPCAPIAKNLRQRGDPVEGWIHFPLNKVRESDLMHSLLRVKVNCALGTCLQEVNGGRAFPNPKGKGVMRKLSGY